MIFPGDPDRPEPNASGSSPQERPATQPANPAHGDEVQPVIVSPDGTQRYDQETGQWHPVPGTAATVAAVRARPKLRGWKLALAIFAAVVVVVAVVEAGNAIFRDTRLQDARDACSAGSVSDGGRTLTLDMAGETPASGLLDAADVACVLGALETPTATVTLMDTTTALDGRQTDSWDGLTASWRYHPDTGLDVIIERD
ncbi:hypothetical protein [Cellulomonas endometrii]|uniref:hypothetical protein n=1 Tax=Cellulomonas endometrii TaxID=3036301 RepID=UPI0024AD916C|nr:hypothetical protein [Cellulomonas endometrii]